MARSGPAPEGLACPVPLRRHERVLLGHGSGGRLMHDLIDQVFAPGLGLPAERHDGAVVRVGGARLAFTTDSYVVRPLFFPGGDIGQLAVYGTVNDLAMCGARPLYLSAGFILEEGLQMDVLRRVVASMGQAAAVAGVQLVTGDTKVVERGQADGLYVNTAGIGVVEARPVGGAPRPGGGEPDPIGPGRVRAGDVVLLSGDLGRHGIAVLGARGGLQFDSVVESDVAPLWGVVRALLDAGVGVRCLRDLTRGGLASAAVEIAEAAGVAIELDEAAIPVRDDVRGVCELLGLDVMHVACEGRFACFVPAEQAEVALEVMRAAAPAAARIGEVRLGRAGQVTLRGPLGGARIVDMLTGEQLPRIC